MQTQTLTVDAHAPQAAVLTAAADVIQRGGLVAFPTETVYGLGADALNPVAVAGIFAAKGRPASDPLIVHLADLDQLELVVAELPPSLAQLHDLVPGPLTLVLPRHARVPLSVSAGRDTVAVRVPAHAVAVGLIRAAATPIAAPSANRFGHTSPTTAAHVLADLAGRIDLVLDGGPTPVGIESTVLDLTSPTPRILRPGGVSLAQLQARLGAVEVAPRAATGAGAPDAGAAPTDTGAAAPGMLERHYAPEHELRLVCGAPDPARAWLAAQVVALTEQGVTVGVLLCAEDIARLQPLLSAHTALIEALGSEADLAQIAHNLYAALRRLDARAPQVILARDFGAEGLGLALRDRLTRAASGNVTWLGDGPA
ncbi:MAG: threonylcarbamoyl-AMP synthase [Chloroflexaceae bacterium]|nr:threonylcarbamoyl-AMP synthase [Chloroflexaceae bacterium]